MLLISLHYRHTHAQRHYSQLISTMLLARNSSRAATYGIMNSFCVGMPQVAAPRDPSFLVLLATVATPALIGFEM